MDRILTLDELLKELDKYQHAELHVHHTYLPDKSSFNGTNHLELQQNMRNFHINTNHWSDIGQHVTLMPDGKFVTGRDFGKIPASIVGYNSIAGVPSFACEMLGNFDVGHDKLEGKQLESIIGLAKYFDEKKKYIRFHRENAPKTCPGTGIVKEDFLKMVQTPKIPAWEQEIIDATKFVVENKISDGKNPKDTLTREQMWVMLYRLSKLK